MFISESIRSYEHFLDENSQIDDNRWKFMYQKDNVKSYAELLVTGTIEGELDDTIYGFVCPTLDMMRIKTSYIQDTMHRACVLASLVKPTAEDPFRTVSIKWIEKGQPFHVRAVIKNRDFVYMESTGTRYLRNGDRIGYQLVHSVQFPETPARDSAIRGNMSMSAIYRQRDNNVVDVFIKGFLNPAGGLTRSIITRSAAKALLSVSKNVHYRKMLEQEVAFCSQCYMEALSAKATTVARQEVLFNDVYGWNEICAYTSGTEISLFDELN
ncbi:hypothetical protein PHPALM_31290 [Phytophthora palmivora]|uniref:START domain-containing protein n=1 Tax=Phytophthora palmivora TaxID=4796 RepID=A0A2P4X2Y3_9STRA|nr:hypothetical protein PHPALM_31290 [Phytophthora palmivora]